MSLRLNWSDIVHWYTKKCWGVLTLFICDLIALDYLRSHVFVFVFGNSDIILKSRYTTYCFHRSLQG